jgi:PII-like signaling protein
MKITILRIYMPVSARAKAPINKTFLQKLFGLPLAGFLLREAKRSGIRQALYQRVEGGYLNAEKLVFDQVEAAPPSLPACVELIDEEAKLRDFVFRMQSEMADCRVIIFQSVELLNPSQERTTSDAAPVA